MSGHSYGTDPTDFHVGDRVELHPATDMWMRGGRFGTVVKVGRRYVHVVMDDGRPRSYQPPWTLRVIEKGTPQ